MAPITYIPSNQEPSSFFCAPFSYIPSNSHFVIDGPEQNVVDIPLSIFKSGLSGLEAIATFLKDVKQMRFCEIARLLNRDDRTIWDACNSASSKSSEAFEESSRTVPLSIFANRSVSVLEAITAYLKEECNLRNCKIAELLGKDARTIWTVYNRFKKKQQKNNQTQQR